MKFFIVAYAALATMTEVFPEPAAATSKTRLSKVITAVPCSKESGLLSILSKNCFWDVSSA